MASTSGGGSTTQLKQVLGFKDLLSTAIGQIIGAGIMTLMGSAIALTGRSVPIAFLISFVLVIGACIPLVIIAGTVRVRGGQYTMVGMLAGKEMAGFFVIMHILANVSLGMYAVVSIVAAGVLPVDVVASQTLDAVARTVLPYPVYAFFMVAGAMFALISTLNAQYAWAPKPVMQACDDGWFPKKLAYLHPKFKTPIVLISILYVIGVICIISGLDVSVLGNLATIADNLIFLIISLFIWRLPKVAGEAWNKSKFKMPPAALRICCVVSAIACIINFFLNVTQLGLPLVVANIVVIAVTLLWAIIRGKSDKVHMEVSYEDT